MRLIILFHIFIHPIIPYYSLQLLLIILLLHQFSHLFLLLRPHNNGLSSMELFKLIMVDPAKCLLIKMNQFICVVVRKDFHDHVWAKPFWKELFKVLLSWRLPYTMTKSPSQNFCGFTLLSRTLDLSYCESLGSLPHSLEVLTTLRKLILIGCKDA